MPTHIADGLGLAVDEAFPSELKSSVSGRIAIREVQTDVMHFRRLIVPLGDAEEVLTLQAFDDVEDNLTADTLRNALNQALGDLTEIEQRVVRGVMAGRTLDAMSLEEAVTRERIRQIRDKAFRKIRENDVLMKNGRVLRKLWEEK
jgi:DNA-directed RNA polymerase sigma subunit (sigma70/sigma32)